MLIAARACMATFGVNTVNDLGGFKDVVEIRSILTETFPDDNDEEVLRDRIASLDAEVEELFKRPNVRAAASALAGFLTHTNDVDGPQAESIIDCHLSQGHLA